MFDLLSYRAASYRAVPYAVSIFESAHAAHVKGIQAIAITGGQTYGTRSQNNTAML